MGPLRMRKSLVSIAIPIVLAACSVLGALKIYGAKDSQVEAVSWDEEKPRATSHDEAAWAQNRRADLSYRN